MYEIQLTVEGSEKAIILTTESRAVARNVALLAAENSDLIEVTVTVAVADRTVKFQGVE